MKVKEPATIQDQLRILSSKGCIVEDQNFAINVLGSINYYRLSSYFLTFKNVDGTYKPNTSFNKIYRLFQFDKYLRNLISLQIESIETLFKAKIAYHFCLQYGSLGYLEQANFKNIEKFSKFILKVKNYIDENQHSPIVLHHIDKYESNFPLWVIIEFFSFSAVSIFYSNMHTYDQKKIARELHTTENHIISWLYCLTYLRNSCAHFTRLYNSYMLSIPRTPRDFEFELRKSVFDLLIVLKLLMGETSEWKNQFIVSLKSLINEYSDVVDLSKLGFKNEWEEILTSNTKYINKRYSSF